MNINEFSNKFAEATKEMSTEEKLVLRKMFEGISKEIENNNYVDTEMVCEEDSSIPDGPTERINKLKEQYMK